MEDMQRGSSPIHVNILPLAIESHRTPFELLFVNAWLNGYEMHLSHT
jgi:hypothetical protein